MPWRAGITEIHLHSEFRQNVGSVVEGEGLALGGGNLAQNRNEPLSGSRGFGVLQVIVQEVAALTFMGHEVVVAVFGEQNEIGSPMPGLAAIRLLDGRSPDGATALDVACGTAVAQAEASTAGLGPGIKR